MMKRAALMMLFSLFLKIGFSQSEDLLSLIDDEETTEYTKASFKTNRVINMHSLENTAGGVFDFKISHRFGFLSGGAYELFGLDQAFIRIGGDYGITDWLGVGFGRSSFQKAFDGFVKVKLLRQSSGKTNMPLTVAYAGGATLNSVKFDNPDRENYFSSRLNYFHQLIIGRKFSEGVSFEILPTVVHRNLVLTNVEKNDVMALGAAGRIKLSKRTAINAEYIYVLPNQIAEPFQNSLSVGFDIETGGHVFQLHFTNSTSMLEPGFIAETTGKFFDGDIHFGFNVSRVFTVAKRKL